METVRVFDKSEKYQPQIGNVLHAMILFGVLGADGYRLEWKETPRGKTLILTHNGRRLATSTRAMKAAAQLQRAGLDWKAGDSIHDEYHLEGDHETLWDDRATEEWHMDILVTGDGAEDWRICQGKADVSGRGGPTPMQPHQ